MANLTPSQLSEVVASVAQHCPTFRELLATDPKAAVESLIQQELPEHFQVQLDGSDGHRILLVSPADIPKEKEKQMELNDEDLEAIAGGVQNVAADGDIGIIFDNSVNYTVLQNITLNQTFINFAPQIRVDMAWFGLG